MVDARKYFGVTFVKLEELAEGTERKPIGRVEEGKFGKLNLIFEDNTAVSLNATNLRALVKAFGPETENWPGRAVELSAGELEFQDKMQPAILVAPASPPLTPEERAAATANLSKPAANGGGGDMDDDIPF